MVNPRSGSFAGDGRRLLSRASRPLLAGLMAILLAAPALGQPARPSTVTLVPGVVTLENVQFEAGTPTDITQPAAGSGTFTVTMGGFTGRKDNVTFTHLLLGAQGQLQGVVLTLDQPFTTSSIAGCTFEIPSGAITWRSPDALSFAGPCLVKFPFRNSDGSVVTASTSRLRAQKTGAQTDLSLDSLMLQGPAGTNGLTLTGLRVAAAPVNLKVSWSGSSAATWVATIPSARVASAVPGLVTSTDLPLKANATGIAVNHKGEVDVQSATLVVDAAVEPIRVQGFELKLKSGSFSMQKSVPSFQSVVADLTFPDGLKNAAGNGPAIVRDVGLNLSDLSKGLVLDIGNPSAPSFALDGLLLGTIRLRCKSMVLDLSNAAGPLGAAPPSTQSPAWTGVWFKTGELRFPLDTDTLAISLDKFFFDANGITGLSTVVPNGLGALHLKGFDVQLKTLKLEFLRNQIVAGTIGGGIDLPNLGDLDAKVEFSLRGLEAIALSSKSGLDLSRELQLSIKNVKGSLALDVTPAMLMLSGTLVLPNPALETKISNFRIDGSGRFYLPEEGVLTLNEPAVVSVMDVIEVEVRRIGFTCPDGAKIQSISFTGAARLKNPIEGMSLGGEIDLEHFTVGLPITATGPTIEIGGLGLSATIPELGTIGASLKMSDQLEGFKGINVLYGDAELALDPLGGVGLDVTFLLALDLEKQAWFIGGDAMLPEPVRVDIPATPTPTPMIPLFQIKGFLGGFGMNVTPRVTEGGIGPIKEPETELEYSRGSVLGQAGIMLAEYAVGDKVWWADATLTATFNPMMFDLTGRMALLDLEGVTGFPKRSEWEDRDRIASVFVNLDLDAHPSMSMGGDLDMNFPSRDFALVDASGEALMRFASISKDKTEAFMHVGCWWCEDKQRPMRMRVASSLKDYIRIRGDAGMEVDFVKMSGQMRLDAEFVFKPVPLEGTLKGTLAVTDVGKSNMKAEGDLSLRGVADFDVVECTVHGKVHAVCTKSKLEFDGTLAGKVGCFEGEVDVEKTFR